MCRIVSSYLQHTFKVIMYQSIPSLPIPSPSHRWDILTTWQFPGWGICQLKLAPVDFIDKKINLLRDHVKKTTPLAISLWELCQKLSNCFRTRKLKNNNLSPVSILKYSRFKTIGFWQSSHSEMSRGTVFFTSSPPQKSTVGVLLTWAAPGGENVKCPFHR